MSSSEDIKFMKIAIRLAKRNLGNSGANPSVGCVLVKNTQIIASEVTAFGGRPHAENLALEYAGKKANDSIAYVTLEPCAHEGETQSCARLLAEAGIKKVVIANLDPDPRTAGKGIKILQEAGLEIAQDVCAEEARKVNSAFFKSVEKILPYVTLKVATSADNKFLRGNNKPVWVTGELARDYVHILRSQSNVIITGTQTVLDDNPSLNVRLPGMSETSPLKIILGKSEVMSDSKIFDGLEAMQFDGDLQKILSNLAKTGISRVMIEAGPKLSNALLKSGLVDELIWIKSDSNLDKKGEDYFDKKNLDSIHKKTPSETFKIGSDRVLKFMF